MTAEVKTLVTTTPAVQTVVDTRFTQDVIPILDTSKFEHMQRIAIAMAETSMVPDSLRGKTVRDGGNDKFVEFDRKVIIANCFRVVNQAVRWGFDPFAVMDCAYIVHGKLGWEGKLVAAVIDAKIGVALEYVFDDKPGQELGVTVSGTLPGEGKARTISGRVKDWHKGAKSPWAQEGAWKRQLRYMGAREWARAHKPSVMLGIYADDELQDIASLDVPAGQRARHMKDITPKVEAPAKPIAFDINDIPDEQIEVANQDTADEPLTDPAGFLALVEEHKGFCNSIEELDELRQSNLEMRERLNDADKAKFDALFEVE